MIKIYGYSVSNYFNQVEFALLEKGIDFESIDTQPSQDDEFKIKSPMRIICFSFVMNNFTTPFNG